MQNKNAAAQPSAFLAYLGKMDKHSNVYFCGQNAKYVREPGRWADGGNEERSIRQRRFMGLPRTGLPKICHIMHTSNIKEI
jgi:hypothetical protein